MAPAHVLVPLDGSPLAEEALEYAIETFDSRTTVLNVVTPLDSGMSEGGVIAGDEDREDSARARAERIVEGARQRAEADQRAVETAVETGDPADAILEFVAETDVDHVVMGGHSEEPEGLVTRLLGSVATTVVAEAPITVTVVR